MRKACQTGIWHVLSPRHWNFVSVALHVHVTTAPHGMNSRETRWSLLRHYSRTQVAAGNIVQYVSIRHCSFWQPGLLHNPADLIISVANIFISPNFSNTQKCNLKSATKPLNVLIAFTRPLITEFADNLNLKHPLLPTISPYPTMWLEAIHNIIPISCRHYPKSVWKTSA